MTIHFMTATVGCQPHCLAYFTDHGRVCQVAYVDLLHGLQSYGDDAAPLDSQHDQASDTSSADCCYDVGFELSHVRASCVVWCWVFAFLEVHSTGLEKPVNT
ncbi:MAG: hypothetical protein [Caudoviricetes sp.]|nr:MAG: hypothetical protein [Caudoviricetes sp.]